LSAAVSLPFVVHESERRRARGVCVSGERGPRERKTWSSPPSIEARRSDGGRRDCNCQRKRALAPRSSSRNSKGMENMDMGIATTVKGRLKKFVPTALRRRFGHASADSPGFRPGTRVLALNEEGEELLARVVRDLGERVRVEFDDGSIEEVDAADLRKVPRRRRGPSAEVAPEASASPEAVDPG
jgi:hypothetical protein